MTMGQSQGKFVFPKCPSPFESAGGLACVMACPTEKGYERRPVAGGFQCVYKADPRYATPLNGVTAAVFNGTSLSDLRKENEKSYTEFIKERDRFVADITVLDGKISKDKKLQDAFRRLQDAENVRDKSPEAYQMARTNYYTLRDGDKWIEQEKERLLKAEIQPTVSQFQKNRNDAMRQFENQRRTIDVVNGLKDKVLTLKDELKYSADTFKDQLAKVQNAINREHRGRPVSSEATIWDWLDTILNIVILSSLLYVIWMIVRKFWWKPRPVAVVQQPVRVVV